MPHNLTATSTFTAPVAVPSGGDERNAASVDTPFQALTNRTEWLKDNKPTKPSESVDNEIPRFDGTDGKTLQQSGVKINDASLVEYATARTVTITVSNLLLRPEDPATSYGLDAKGTGISVQADSAVLGASVGELLTDRCTIKGFSANVNPGAARSGTNRMNIELWRTPRTGVPVQIGSTVYDDTTGSTQTLTSATVTEVVDRANNTYHLRVQMGNTAGAAPDVVIWLGLSVLEAGPGLGG